MKGVPSPRRAKKKTSILSYLVTNGSCNDSPFALNATNSGRTIQRSKCVDNISFHLLFLPIYIILVGEASTGSILIKYGVSEQQIWQSKNTRKRGFKGNEVTVGRTYAKYQSHWLSCLSTMQSICTRLAPSNFSVHCKFITKVRTDALRSKQALARYNYR